MHDGLQNMDGTLIPTADMTKIKQNVLMKTLELHYPMIQFLIINNYSTSARWVWDDR